MTRSSQPSHHRHITFSIIIFITDLLWNRVETTVFLKSPCTNHPSQVTQGWHRRLNGKNKAPAVLIRHFHAGGMVATSIPKGFCQQRPAHQQIFHFCQLFCCCWRTNELWRPRIVRIPWFSPIASILMMIIQLSFIFYCFTHESVCRALLRLNIAFLLASSIRVPVRISPGTKRDVAAK